MKKFAYCLAVFWMLYICYFSYMLIAGKLLWWNYLLRLIMTVCNLYLAIDYIRKKKDA